MQPYQQQQLSRIRLIRWKVLKGQITTATHLQASRETVLWMRKSLLTDRSLSVRDRVQIHSLSGSALQEIDTRLRALSIPGSNISSRTTTSTQTHTKPLMESYH